MTQEEFLKRINEMMCSTSNEERAFLSADMYKKIMNEFENKLKEWVENDGDWFIIFRDGGPSINEIAVDSIMHKLKGE